MTDRQVLAERLNEVGLLEDRLIPVEEGSKASVVNHHKAKNRESTFIGISGNYGVYAGAVPDGDRTLVVVDKDDEAEGIEAADGLGETLSVETPHTDSDLKGHDYYVIDGENVAERLKDAVGVYNPVPDWGEVRVRNQYVVGPGSELDSCDKDWHDCSEPGEGQYTIANDAPIAEIKLDDLIEVLRESGYDDADSGSKNGTNASFREESDGDGYEEALEVARNDEKIVTYLTQGAGVDFDGDRSEADFYVACRMVENHVPKAQAEKLLLNGLGDDHTPDTKVRERGGWYANTWENARQKVKRENSGSSGSDGGDGSDSTTQATSQGRIVVEDGTTYYEIDGDRQEVLNFALDVDSILRVDGREVIEATLKRPGGATDDVQFEPRHLQKKQRFKDNVISGKFGLTFTPPGRMAETVLNALNEYIGQLDVPVRDGTHHIGLHNGEWVTPAGSLGPDGWLDEPQTVYVDRDVALERAINLPTDSGAYDTGSVREILSALPETRETARILPVLGWFYAAPLRPYIFGDWGAGAFNHLNVTGDTGSGKTTTLRYLWRCFGVDSDPFAVTDTKFAMLAALAASNGLPVWYDEYKPSEIPDYKLNNFHDRYRKAATGGTAGKGRPDQTTEEYHIHAPVVVSGEEQIRRPAERRRSIMVTFREDVTDKGTDTRAAFKELVGEGRVENGELVLPEDAPDPTDHALAYYRWIAGADAADLRAKWQDARELVWQKRREWDDELELDDMEVQGLQTVAFGWQVMRAFARDHGLDADALPGEEELADALRHIAGEIGPDGQRKSHMDRFVELFERAAAAGYVKRGQHYDVVHEGSPGEEELRIHLSRAYDALSKYAQDHGLGSEELLSNAADYRKRFKEAAETAESYVVTHSQVTPGLGRCAGLSTIQAMNTLEFDRATFDVEPIDSDDGTESPGGQSQQAQAATDGGDDEADGHGAEHAARKIVQWLNTTKQSTTKADLVADVSQRYDISPETCKRGFAKAKEDGRIQESPTASGKFEAT